MTPQLAVRFLRVSRPRLHSRAALAAALTTALLLGITGCGSTAQTSTAAPKADSAASQTPAPLPLQTPAPPSPAQLRRERAVDIVNAASTRENVARITMSSAEGSDPATLRAFVEEHGLGGFILMGGNIPADPVTLSGLTSQLTVDPEQPTIVAIDQEGGIVSRLPWDELPSADTLKYAGPAAVEEAFAARAALLESAGIDVNFGIVADFTDDTGSFIYPRALGATSAEASNNVTAAVAGEFGLVSSTLKHFPGHGATPGDSHDSIPYSALTHGEWLDTTAPPFQAGVDAGADLLMFGHLSFSAVDPAPASLSEEWHRIAREELGFAGLTITDDLGMLLSSGVEGYADPGMNATAALAAGNDVLLFIAGADPGTLAATIDAVAAAVDGGVVPQERLDEAAIRVTEFRLHLGEQQAGATP